jgi:outer membrane receptor protein involved in Fe transport
MPTSTSRVSRVRLAVLTALFSSAPVAVADAQTAPARGAAGADTLDEVVVTGSRIRRPQVEGNIPGTQTTAVEIEFRAFNNAQDILNDLPLVGTGATNLGNNGGQPASLGQAFVDLLDLGTQRTLTLVNGRRFVSNNGASLFVFGNESGAQVDVNLIPTDLIDRIDVLTVGGAAAYGSDAIAGVVNYILRDDFDGLRVRARFGQTTRGDGEDKQLSGTWGLNFAEGRGNFFVHASRSEIDGIQADQRAFRRDNPGGLTNYADGSRRNPSFATAIIDVAGQNNGAFLRAADDGVSGVVYQPALTNGQLWPGGVIFNTLATVTGSVNQIGPAAAAFFAGNTQLIPGVPGTGNPSGATGNSLSTFAPNALPTGVTAAQVFAAFGVTPPAGSTAAQQTTLAINVLQANRPTPREYYGNNPSTPLNAFLGTFIASFPDVANPVAGQNAFLPRLAVPIRFDNAGNVVPWRVATLGPDTPSTIGGTVGGEGFNAIFNTVLRVDQTRDLANFNARFDLTDNIRVFTQNTYGKVESSSLRNAGSANSAASGTVENAALVMNVANPFLTADNRAALAAAGITGNFVLSRTNQDIAGPNAFEANNRTVSTTNGLEGDFEWADRKFNWDAAVAYGKSDGTVTTYNIKDVEFALAIDAVVNPANGQIVCRAQLSPTVPTSVPGVSPNLIRVIGPDGIPTEQIFTPTPTRQQVDFCVPLNPFGFDRMSQAAKNYVLGRQDYTTVNEQTLATASFAGDVIDLPGGKLQFATNVEWRKVENEQTVDQLSQFGRTRTAAIAQTAGELTTKEGGIELNIPIFGGEFSFPLLRSLEFAPKVRTVKQDGEAPAYRTLTGQIREQKAEGDWRNITELAARWKPFEDLTIRALKTSSIRQPNVVELFLGGQPSFTTPADPCSNQRINQGPNPAARRANCAAEVVRAGLAPDAAAAATFLNGFVSSNRAVQGSFSGSPSLAPEEADSWTAGFIYQPSFARGLTVSSDYISIDLEKRIFPTNLVDAQNFCYDSPSFPDNSPEFGANTCAFFVRDAQFQVTDGFQSGFLNLAATRLRAVSGLVAYQHDLGGLFRSDRDIGNIDLELEVFRLISFEDSASGRFDDTRESQGSFDRPEWRAKFRARYDLGPFAAQWTMNWRDSTIIYSAGTPATVDNQAIISYPSTQTHDFTLQYRFGGENLPYRAQFTLVNAFDETTAGDEGLLNAAYVDQLGRRWVLGVTADF